MEVSIAAVEEPVFIAFERDTAVSLAMSKGWDHQKLRWQTSERMDGLEAKPVFTDILIYFPLYIVCDLAGDIPLFVLSADRCIQLSFVDVDFGMWEICKSACVVEIKMGWDDVANIAWLESQSLYLRNGCFLWLVHWSREQIKEGTQAAWMIDVVLADPCVDEDKTVF